MEYSKGEVFEDLSRNSWRRIVRIGDGWSGLGEKEVRGIGDSVVDNFVVELGCKGSGDFLSSRSGIWG